MISYVGEADAFFPSLAFMFANYFWYFVGQFAGMQIESQSAGSTL
jgi:hypothetical protein